MPGLSKHQDARASRGSALHSEAGAADNGFMERRPTTLGEAEWRGDPTALEPAVVRLVVLAAAFAAVTLAVLYLASGDPGLGRQSLAASAPAIAGVVLTIIGRPHTLAILSTAAAATVIGSAFSGTAGHTPAASSL